MLQRHARSCKAIRYIREGSFHQLYKPVHAVVGCAALQCWYLLCDRPQFLPASITTWHRHAGLLMFHSVIGSASLFAMQLALPAACRGTCSADKFLRKTHHNLNAMSFTTDPCCEHQLLTSELTTVFVRA